jgi:hypothetical protein
VTAREFEGEVTSSLTTNFASIGSPLPTLSSSVSTASLGTYGQFGLGIAAQFMSTGWVSYLRGDYRTGDNIEGWSLNGGLRYQFVPDPPARGRGPMIAKAPIREAPAAPAVYNWAGFYIGGYAGAAWGLTNWTFADDAATTTPAMPGSLAALVIAASAFVTLMVPCIPFFNTESGYRISSKSCRPETTSSKRAMATYHDAPGYLGTGPSRFFN